MSEKLFRMINGVRVEVSDEEAAQIRAEWTQSEAVIKANEYKVERQAAYPSIGDQLDMIYHDKMNGTNMWSDLITSIKNQYPKPAGE